MADTSPLYSTSSSPSNHHWQVWRFALTAGQIQPNQSVLPNVEERRAIIIYDILVILTVMQNRATQHWPGEQSENE